MSNLAMVINNNEANVSYMYDQKFVEFYEEFIKSQRSENTATAYRTDLKQFFMYTFKKEYSHVTLKDMFGLTSLQAMKYHNHLKTVGKNATVKRKIDAVRSFLNALAVDNKEINPNIFDNLNIESVNLDREGYGNIDWDEAFLFIEYAHIEQMEDDQMAMLMKLACITSIRLEALLTMNWEEDFRTKNEKGVLVNYIDKIDKHQRHQTPISAQFFAELQDKLGATGNLFPQLHEKKVGKFLKEILTYFEIDKKRNIKFHSFKKCGVNRVLDKTGDLTKAQLQGKHKSIVTTQTNYIALKDDLTMRPSFTLDQDMNITQEIKDIPHSELLDAITKLSDSAKFELLRNLQK